MKLYINLLNYRDNNLAGTGYFMKRLFEGLSRHPLFFKKFTEIIILCPENVDIIEVFSVPSFDNIRLKRIPFIHLSLLLRIFYEQLVLPVFLFLRQPCMYFAPNPMVPLFSKILNPKMRSICTIHDLIPFHIPEKYGYLRRKYIQCLSVLSARVSTKVVTVSEYSKADIISITGIKEEKVAVIYNFINAELSLNNAKLPFFLTICTIEPGKNIELMLDGFSAFLEKNPAHKHYRYFIVGKPGWNYDAIYRYARGLSCAENVSFLGYLDEKNKNQYLKDCTALLYLSKYEGFGIPILEAMYYGKPSIVSNSSALPEVVGKAGVIIAELNKNKIAEGMELIISDYDLYVSRIPAQVSKFIPTVQIERFINLFN